MRKHGPKFWDFTLAEADRIVSASKSRYRNIPTTNHGADMRHTRNQFFLLACEMIRHMYLRRIANLNPGEPLSWRYVPERNKALASSAAFAMLSDNTHQYRIARKTANTFNRTFFWTQPPLSQTAEVLNGSLNTESNFRFSALHPVLKPQNDKVLMTLSVLCVVPLPLW
ncbi:putative f-actin capping protein beta subunit [Trypanosoma grayi]|uniref:putative f-actin capping protein beta subunit n=1 Tax=Trypanosoma grayi TaxID=71804 RepID=UPI0004F3FA34|nr:putative f-actin capping protein beta subunit [Trypanosoma grayi]KEG07996.1 putative f-actin capping protein beta subunit [Trypanosoma grayi]